MAVYETSRGHLSLETADFYKLCRASCSRQPAVFLRSNSIKQKDSFRFRYGSLLH